MDFRRVGTIATATGLFTGYLPLAPGTWGSALAAGFLFLVGGIPTFWHLLLTAALLIGGALAAAQSKQLFGKDDASKIVIDEIVGVMVTMIGIPCTGYWVVIGFLVFRFFDITKPPPAKFFDTKLKNGWGVMLDDVVAGIYGNILLHLMLRATL